MSRTHRYPLSVKSNDETDWVNVAKNHGLHTKRLRDGTLVLSDAMVIEVSMDVRIDVMDLCVRGLLMAYEGVPVSEVSEAVDRLVTDLRTQCVPSQYQKMAWEISWEAVSSKGPMKASATPLKGDESKGKSGVSQSKTKKAPIISDGFAAVIVFTIIGLALLLFGGI